ncbi:hypothetical protein ACJJTC_001791 [Scirpophaga incertulas]
MCVRAMNGLASAGLITMDEASCIEATEAGRLMSFYYLDLETMKLIMKIQGNESLERMLTIICECHELADMHLRVDERRCLNALNRSNTSATIRFPMKGKINTRQMKLSCIIQAVLGCLPIPDPSLNQEAMKVMRIAERICKCLVSYVTRPELISQQQTFFSAILNSIILAKCSVAHLWENSPFVSRQLRGIGPTFSTLLATAGKVNFILIEETHPRDLERIMNKGPPAGNLLRKQISLLPKYQLAATPIDEKTVSVELLLLNQSHMSENMEHLTAGTTHKSYLIAGDSKNHVLLLTTFKDNDLISVFNGTMKFEITRKHDLEHKIMVKCISSTFVGIDVECEYTFMNLVRVSYDANFDNNCETFFENESKPLSLPKNYTKGRKRKISEPVAQSKEKQKKELALAEKIRLLKESFDKKSNKIKYLQKTKDQTENVLNELNEIDCVKRSNEPLLNVDIENVDNVTPNNKLEDSFDNETISNILIDIENEITKNYKIYKSNKQEKCWPGPINDKFVEKKGSNYKFLELKLNKNVVLSDDEGDSNKNNGFSESIKKHVANYMENSRNNPVNSDLTANNLCIDTHRQSYINDLLPLSKLSVFDKDATSPIRKYSNVIHNNIDENIISNRRKDEELIDDIIDEKIITVDVRKHTAEILDSTKHQERSLQNHNIIIATNNRGTSVIDNKNKQNLLDTGDEKISLNEKHISNILELTKDKESLLSNNEVIVTKKNECSKFNGQNQNEFLYDITEANFGVKEKHRIKLIESINSLTDITNDQFTKNNTENICSVTQNNILNVNTNELVRDGNNLVENTNEPTKEANNMESNGVKIIDDKMKFQSQQGTCILSNNDIVIAKKKKFAHAPDTSLYNDSIVRINKNDTSCLNNESSNVMSENIRTNYNFNSGNSKLYKNNYDGLSSPCTVAKNVSAIYVDNLINNERNYFLEYNEKSTSLYNDSISKIKHYTLNSNPRPKLSDLNQDSMIINETNSSYKSNVSTKKYVFTGDQYDMHTNSLENVQVHIFKKIKIDLDITEIICDKSKINKSIFESTDNNAVLNNTSKLSDKATNKENNDLNKSNNRDLIVTKYADNINILDLTSKKNNDLIIFESKKEGNDNKNIQNTYIKDTAPVQIENNDNTNNSFEDPKISGTIENKEQSVDETAIKKILAKYSTKLRQNKNCDLKTIYPIHKIRKVDEPKLKSFSSPKPFKLSAIDRLHLNLESLCDPVVPDNRINSNINVSQTERDLNSNPVAYQPSKYYYGTDCSNNHINTCSEGNTVDGSNWTQYSPPLTNNEFSQINVNIDNNLLDPKTLLKYYNDDEDTNIVPPPVEFSDNTYNAYSPNASDTYINLPTQRSQLPRIDSFETIDVDIAPIEEIETWHVTDGDLLQNNFPIEPSASSYLRNDNNDNLPSNFSPVFSGRRLLSQFKLNSKDKLKPKWKSGFLRR